MSIFGAMNAGVSGLGAQAQAMGMIADNIANVNTIAYKGVSARFSTLVTVEPTRAFHTPGGVRSNRFQEIDQQGLLQSSPSKTDLGIAGDGMFVVRENPAAVTGGEFLFTRDGSFITDNNGNLMTSTGNLFLQGLRFDQMGNLPTQAFANLETVNIQGLSVTAEPTTTMDIAANLPADDAIGTVHQVTLPLYDSQGALQNMDYFFVKTAVDTWALTGRFSDPNTNFASNDTTTANLAATALADETNFTFNSSVGNFFGAVLTGAGDITATKTTATNTALSIAVGSETFNANFALTNNLPVETEIAYSSSTTGMNGTVGGGNITVTPGSPVQVDIVVGAATFTGTIPTDAGGGADISLGQNITLTDGTDTLVLTIPAGSTLIGVDLDASVVPLQTALDLAFDTAGTGTQFSSGAIVDGVADLIPGNTITLTASGGQTLLLDLAAGGASYDLSDDADLATLDANLTAALNGMVLQNGSVGFRMADIGFSATGRLQSITALNSPYMSVNANDELDFFIDFDNSAATDITQDRNQVTLNLGTFGQLDGLKQFAGDFFIGQTDQNGKRFGNFTTLEISEDGIITAVFDNGERTDIYQLALANFANVNGLEARSGNAFQETDFSGQAQLLLPNTAGAGSVVSGALEASTVDIAEEFTKMIVTQRAYSASARVITTADEMLEELLRIRR
ncbi:MAG: flagellar hook-basal body complex protein [Alphaproteobacteria bacterium]|nr:flagellar hook-basal body complex protein [Alphaproteobacteria bacterium]